MKKVHPTAVLKGEVELGEGVEIGPYTIIEGKVKIGRGTRIGARVSIRWRWMPFYKIWALPHKG